MQAAATSSKREMNSRCGSSMLASSNSWSDSALAHRQCRQRRLLTDGADGDVEHLAGLPQRNVPATKYDGVEAFMLRLYGGLDHVHGVERRGVQRTCDVTAALQESMFNRVVRVQNRTKQVVQLGPQRFQLFGIGGRMHPADGAHRITSWSTMTSGTRCRALWLILYISKYVVSQSN